MASTASNNGLEDVASSLSADDVVPQKMRCAICDRLAFNAFKLPCCDQNICADCQSTLPEACPVCQHSPLSAEDTKASKALRLTIGQFLKGIKKRRDKSQASSAPSENTGAESAAPTTRRASLKSVAMTVDYNESGLDNRNAYPKQVLQGKQQDLVTSAGHAQSIVDLAAGQDATGQYSEASGVSMHPIEEIENVEEILPTDDNVEDSESDTSDIQIFTGDEEAKAIDQENWDQDSLQNPQQWMDQSQLALPQINGQDFALSGDFSQMGFTPEMMQMLLQMGNGGWPNMMNMMGMPGMGMGMNHLDMSAMFGQLGMQGMGNVNPNMMSMSAMNGMTDINFNGSFGGWAGQQLNVDFGASNGFYPSSGYNQSHHGDFPHMSHHQQTSKHSFHNTSSRGSQRGFGRGYHNQGLHGRFHSQNMPTGDGPPPGAPTGPRALHRGTENNNHHLQNPVPQRLSSLKSSPNQQLTLSNENSTPGNTEPKHTNLNHDTQVGHLEREPKSNIGYGAQSSQASVNDGLTDGAGSNIAEVGGSVPSVSQIHHQTDESINGGKDRPDQGENIGTPVIPVTHGGLCGSNSRQISSTAHSNPPIEFTGKGVEGAPTGPKALREGGTRAGRGPSNVVGSTNSASVVQSRNESVLASVPVRDRSLSRSRHRSRRQRSQSLDSESNHVNERDQKRRRATHLSEEDLTLRNGNRQEKKRHCLSEEASHHEANRSSEDRVRSSKRHRKSSKERRRHRHRSRSSERPASRGQQPNVMDDEKSQEKVRRREKDRYRDQSREKERHRDRSRSYGRDRNRTHHRKHSSRRDRSTSRESDHRQSLSRGTSNRDIIIQDRSNRHGMRNQLLTTKSALPETLSLQKQLQAASRKEGFQIQGRHKAKLDAANAASHLHITPSDDGATRMQPPSGPRLDRAVNAPKTNFDVDTSETATQSSTRHILVSSSTRTSQIANPMGTNAPSKASSSLDPYEEERRLAQQARIAKELSRRKFGEILPSGSLARKRSYIEEDVPIGPKDRKSKKSRSVAYRYESESELGRDEDERGSARYR